MSGIFGFVLSLGAVVVFYYSLPRDGKLAKFVGTAWEGYAVVGMIGVFCVGAILIITGLAQAMK
jgi:hypothetical protein